MQLSVLLLALATSGSAWIVSECDGSQSRDLRAGRCYEFNPGKQAKYASNNNCRVTFYTNADCTGAAWGSKSQNKCLSLPLGGSIKSVFCSEA
jgi:hypothetical protein